MASSNDQRQRLIQYCENMYSATPLERSYGNYLYQLHFAAKAVNPNGFSIAGRDAVPFLLQQTALDRLLLRHMWTVADPDEQGTLFVPQQWYLLLRLLALSTGPIPVALAQMSKAPASQNVTPVHVLMHVLQQTARDTTVRLATFQDVDTDAIVRQLVLQQQQQGVQPAPPVPTQPDPFQQMHAAPSSFPTQQQAPSQPPDPFQQMQGAGMQQQQQQQQMPSAPYSTQGAGLQQQPPQAPAAPPQKQEPSGWDALDALASDDDAPLPSLSDWAATTTTQEEETPAPAPLVSDEPTTVEPMPAPTLTMGPAPAPKAAPSISVNALDSMATTAGNILGDVSSAPSSTIPAAVEDEDDEFGGFASAPAAEAPAVEPAGAGFSPTPAAPFPETTPMDTSSGWDALDALAAVEDAPLPSLPGWSAEPSTETEPAAEEGATSQPPPVAMESQDEGEEDDFGDFHAVSSTEEAAPAVDTGTMPRTAPTMASPPVVEEGSKSQADSTFGEFVATPAAMPESGMGPLDSAAPTEETPDEADFGDFVQPSTESGAAGTGLESVPAAAPAVVVEEASESQASFGDFATHAPATEETESKVETPVGAEAVPAIVVEEASESQASFGDFAAAPVESTSKGTPSTTAVVEDAHDSQMSFGDFAAAPVESTSTEPPLATQEKDESPMAMGGDMMAGEPTAVTKEDAASAFRPSSSDDVGLGGHLEGKPPLPPTGPRSVSVQPPVTAGERSDSDFYSARTSSLATASGNMSEFHDAEHEEFVRGTNLMASPSEPAPAPSAQPAPVDSDDPFSAFDNLAPPVAAIPPLSSYSFDSTEQRVAAATALPKSQESILDAQDRANEDFTGFGVGAQDDAKEIMSDDDDFAAFHSVTSGGIETDEDAPQAQANDLMSDDEFGTFHSVCSGDGTDDQAAMRDSMVSADKVSSALGEQEKMVSGIEGAVGIGGGDVFSGFASAEGGPAITEPVDAKDESMHGTLDAPPVPTVEAADSFGSFGDFESAPAVAQAPPPEAMGEGFGAFAAVASSIPSASQGPESTPAAVDLFAPTSSDAAQALEVAEPHSSSLLDEPVTSPVLAVPPEQEPFPEGEAEFGEFESIPAAPDHGTNVAPVTSTAQEPAPVQEGEAEFGDFESIPAAAGSGTDVAPATASVQSSDDGDWDAFQGPETTAAVELDNEIENVQQARDRIVALSLQLPEALRLRAGSSGEHVDFGDCVDANIGLEDPITENGRQRIQNCSQILSLLSSSHSKLASTYWEQAVGVIRDELTLGCTLLEEATHANFSDTEKKLLLRPLETWVHGLGEFIRIVRSVEATIGDLLLLDASAMLTIDTFASSWCSVALLQKTMEVETLWNQIEEMAKKLGLASKQDSTNPLESVVEIRSRGLVDRSSSPLCQFTLQPLSKESNSTATKTPVDWKGNDYMACAANFLANRCAFYVVKG